MVTDRLWDLNDVLVRWQSRERRVEKEKPDAVLCAVLAEFRKLPEKTVVWNRFNSAWRKRMPQDGEGTCNRRPISAKNLLG